MKRDGGSINSKSYYSDCPFCLYLCSPKPDILLVSYLFVVFDSVLAPVLNMPVSDSKRQRVLVASCVLYSEVSLFIF